MSGDPQQVIEARTWLTAKAEAALALPPVPVRATDYLAAIAEENRIALQYLAPGKATA